MKMGEIRWDPHFGFCMQTPDGQRSVTLRCTHKGEVMVEEVAGGGMSIEPLKIAPVNTLTITSPAAQNANALAALRRNNIRNTNKRTT